jgi:hypothetical protein
MTVIGKLIKQCLVILLGWVKVRVYEWEALAVSPCPHCSRVFAAPDFHPTGLLSIRRVACAFARLNRWLEMVRQSKNKMYPSLGASAGDTLPGVSWQQTGAVHDLLSVHGSSP